MDVAVEIPIWSGPRSIRSTLNAYITLTKPRVIELLFLVTIPTMFLAENGVPSLWLVLATLVGGALSAGSSGAFNCDIDRVMRRTQGRPLVTGELTDRQAFVFAWARRITSASCSNKRFRFSASRNNAASSAVLPDDAPTTSSSSRSAFCNQTANAYFEIPKSFAI